MNAGIPGATAAPNVGKSGVVGSRMCDTMRGRVACQSSPTFGVAFVGMLVLGVELTTAAVALAVEILLAEVVKVSLLVLGNFMPGVPFGGSRFAGEWGGLIGLSVR